MEVVEEEEEEGVEEEEEEEEGLYILTSPFKKRGWLVGGKCNKLTK